MGSFCQCDNSICGTCTHPNILLAGIICARSTLPCNLTVFQVGKHVFDVQITEMKAPHNDVILLRGHAIPNHVCRLVLCQSYHQMRSVSICHNIGIYIIMHCVYRSQMNAADDAFSLTNFANFNTIGHKLNPYVLNCVESYWSVYCQNELKFDEI